MCVAEMLLCFRYSSSIVVYQPINNQISTQNKGSPPSVQQSPSNTEGTEKVQRKRKRETAMKGEVVMGSPY
jgi:hypothetical protein